MFMLRRRLNSVSLPFVHGKSMRQFQRWRVRQFRHFGLCRCLLLVLTLLALYRLTSRWLSPAPLLPTPTPRHRAPPPRGEGDIFAEHFMGTYRFHANNSGSGGVERSDKEEEKTYPRLPDDWPQFFVPRSERQFSLDTFPYVHQAKDACSGKGSKTVDLLVIVPSSPTDLNQRNAVRETWGSYAQDMPWPEDWEGPDGTVALIFLLGEEAGKGKGKGKGKTEGEVTRESEEHGDIVQWRGLEDTYYNLTMKVLLGLRWATQHCSQAGHVMKADQDTFVHVPRLLRRLVANPGWRHAIAGPYFKSSPCRRVGKHAVSRQAYPFDHYPPHVKGNVYLLPGDLVPRLAVLAPYLPYNNMEDVHVTGSLARALGVPHEPFLGREMWAGPEPPPPCALTQDPFLVACPNVPPALAEELWRSFNDGILCPDVQ